MTFLCNPRVDAVSSSITFLTVDYARKLSGTYLGRDLRRPPVQVPETVGNQYKTPLLCLLIAYPICG